MKRYKDFQPTGFDSKGLNADYYDIGEFWVAPIGRNRDSDLLDESNWDEGLALLGGESETVQVHRFGHWACGWFEIVLIDPAAADKVAIAEEIESRLENYPILDEDDYNNRQWDEVCRYWSECSIRERVEYCQQARVSVFAARRGDDIPEGVQDRLLDSIR